MTALQASQLWLMSGALAIVFSCLLGFAMLTLVKRVSEGNPIKSINLRQLGAAHLDWLMLSFMLALASGFVQAFALDEVPRWAVLALVFGAWVNPLSYLFRAFGVNAFVFAGGPLQRLSSALGGISASAIVAGWLGLVFQAWPVFVQGLPA